MFANINYERFGANPKRNGFSSVKRMKSQKYLVVKQAEQLTNTECDFDEFNKIEFNEEQTDEDHNLILHEMFPEKHEFENDLEKKEEPVVSSSININHEIVKMKAMSQFLSNIDIQKSKKQSQKYSRN